MLNLTTTAHHIHQSFKQLTANYHLLPHELVVDYFAGGGGASVGMQSALGRCVDIAINHDEDAIRFHHINHPNTKHYCESVWDVDPIEATRGRPIGLAWFSPDCKHFSRAKSGQPVDKNIRGLAWVFIKWAALVPIRIGMLENVVEFADWGPLVEVAPGVLKPNKEKKGETFKAFIAALTTGLDKGSSAFKDIYDALFRCNYDINTKLAIYKKIRRGLGYNVEYRAMSACDVGVPTIRKRLYMIARNDGLPIHWPTLTHGNDISQLPYQTAADIIDWKVPPKSIFARKRQLADKTIMRIAKGIEQYGFYAENPFVVDERHAIPFTKECPNDVTDINNADKSLQVFSVEVKGNNYSLVAARLNQSESEKLHSGKYGEDYLYLSHMIKFRGDNIGHGTNEPVHTISAGGFHIGEVRTLLVQYDSSNNHIGIEEFRTLGLLLVDGKAYQIADIALRMLEPYELFRAMGFPNSYQIMYDLDGNKFTKANQVARCGNAVCPPMAEAMVRANIGSTPLLKVA